MALLQVIRGGTPGTRHEIGGPRTTLGRHPGSNVVLDNIAVSRTHAQIVEDEGRFFIEDLRSRNGTYVNGELIEAQVPLHDSDEIEICDILFRFYVGEPTNGDVVSDHAVRETIDIPQPTEHGIKLSPGDLIGDMPPRDESSGSSSIITTLQASDSGNSWRLSIKPEAKLRAVLSISRALRKVVDLDKVLHTVLDSTFALFPQAEQGFFMLRDANKQLRVRATRVRDHRQADVNISMTIIRKALETGEAILSADATDDSRFEMSESLNRLEIRSMMCVPILGSRDERLGVLQIDTRNIAQQFSQDDLDILLAVTFQAALAIENAALLTRLVEQQTVDRELELAREIQLGFLPSRVFQPDGYEIAHYYKPAEQIGGDYFDCFRLGEGRLAIAVGDVAGKGIPAALLMARLYSAVQGKLIRDQDPAETLKAVNQEFGFDRSVFRFITVMIVILDYRKHQIAITNAGHFPLLLCTPDGEVTRIGIREAGMPIGVVAEQEFETLVLDLPPGARFLMYSDGITEATNAERSLFGRSRLAQVLADDAPSATALVDRVIAAVDDFRNHLPQSDDSCLVAVRRPN